VRGFVVDMSRGCSHGVSKHKCCVADSRAHTHEDIDNLFWRANKKRRPKRSTTMLMPSPRRRISPRTRDQGAQGAHGGLRNSSQSCHVDGVADKANRSSTSTSATTWLGDKTREDKPVVIKEKRALTRLELAP
jgi:hypothetical protein